VGEGGVANEVAMEGAVILRVEKFRYLGSFIKENEDIDKDINQRIKIGGKSERRRMELESCVIRRSR